MEALKNTLETLKAHPYACFLGGFALAVAYGVARLLALLETLGAA